MNNRFLDLQISSITDTLLLTELDGMDYLCHPFYFELTVVSENTALSVDKIIGKTASIQIGSQDQNPQNYNGIISRIIKGELGSDGFQTYKFEMQPWLSFLKNTSDYCNFHECAHWPIPEIITYVFQKNGMMDYDLSKLQKKYEPLNYCVQSQESDFDFITRILNQAGIYYYFKHTSNKHIMVLEDSGALSNNYPADVKTADTTHSEHYIYDWKQLSSSVTHKQTRINYDFSTPSNAIIASAMTNFTTQKQSEEFYHTHISMDASPSQLEHLAKLNAQSNELKSNKTEGKSAYLNFYAGTVFNLTDSDKDNGKYVIYAIAHKAKDTTGRAGHTSENGSTHQYENDFQCYPANKTYVPEASAVKTQKSKPTISGVQSATVVGPKNNEIYTDKYARIKVQFHWDRYGNKDENSSYWIRTKQAWASDQYGTQFIPRVGQEVLVNFEGGDPDRPIIIGSAINENHKPPFDPVKNPTQSGFKSHSLQSNNPDDGNILRFEDQASSEEIYLHAQKDLSVNVGDESKKTIHGKLTTTLQKGDLISLIKDNLTIQAKISIQLACGSSEINITDSDIAIQTGEINFNPAVSS